MNPTKLTGSSAARAWFAALVVVALGCWQLGPAIHCADECTVDFEALRGPTARVLHCPDARLTTWIIAWGQRALLSHPASLFDTNAFYPARNTLTGSEHLLGVTLLTLPLRAFTSNAVLIHQVSLILSYLLLGLTSFALIRWLTSSLWAACVAGVVTMYMPWRLTEIAHIQLLSCQWFPLVWLLIGRIMLEDGTRRHVLLLNVFLTLQLLTSYYLAYFLLLSCAVLILTLAAFRKTTPAVLFRLAGAFALPMAVFVLTSLPYLEREVSAELNPRVAHVSFAGLRMSWLSIAPMHTLVWEFPKMWSYSVPSVVFFLASVALPLGLLARQPAPDQSRRIKAFLVALLLIALSGFVMSLGNRIVLWGESYPLPGALASQILPGFSKLRGPARWLILASLAAPLLTGICVLLYARVLRSIGTGLGIRLLTSAVHALVASLLYANLTRTTLPVRPAFAGTEAALPAYQVLRELPDGPVVEIPWHMHRPTEIATDSSYMLASTLHWKPLLNGFTAYRPRTYAFLKRFAQDLPEASALETFRKLTDVRWVVVHVDRFFPRTRVTEWIRAARQGRLIEVYADEATHIYEIPEAESGGEWMASLLSAEPRTLTLTGLPRNLLDLAAGSGRIQATAPAQVQAGRRSTLPFRLSLEISNHTGWIWPGLDIQSDGLVAARYTFLSGPERTEVLRGIAPLDADVPAHATLITSPFIRGPGVGEYTLRVELVQQLAQGIRNLPIEATEARISFWPPGPRRQQTDR